MKQNELTLGDVIIPAGELVAIWESAGTPPRKQVLYTAVFDEATVLEQASSTDYASIIAASGGTLDEAKCAELLQKKVKARAKGYVDNGNKKKKKWVEAKMQKWVQQSTSEGAEPTDEDKRTAERQYKDTFKDTRPPFDRAAAVSKVAALKWTANFVRQPERLLHPVNGDFFPPKNDGTPWDPNGCRVCGKKQIPLSYLAPAARARVIDDGLETILYGGKQCVMLTVLCIQEQWTKHIHVPHPVMTRLSLRLNTNVLYCKMS